MPPTARFWTYDALCQHCSGLEMIETLSSDKNPLLKDVRKAVARGSLTESGFAVAESFHLLEEALGAGCEVQAILVAESVKNTVSAHVRGLKRTRVLAVRDGIFAQLASTE